MRQKQITQQAKRQTRGQRRAAALRGLQYLYQTTAPAAVGAVAHCYNLRLIEAVRGRLWITIARNRPRSRP